MLVRGGVGMLNDDQKKHIIGYREYNVGFDGLIDRDICVNCKVSAGGGE